MGKPLTSERSAFGERLYQARMHAGLEQEELARLAGMAQSTISGLEKHGTGSRKVATLARVTGVRVEWLERDEGPMVDADVEPPGEARTIASEKVAHHLYGNPAADYRTVALSLAASLAESGVELSVAQFIKLLEATYEKLQRS